MATIKEIKEELAKITELESPLFKEFEKDSRSGVQKEIEKRKKSIQAEIDENLRLEGMLSYEKELYAQGTSLIAGVDEVGFADFSDIHHQRRCQFPIHCSCIHHC